MYERILIPTDGSACSDAAVAQGAKLAKALGSEVTILHALDALAFTRDGFVTIAEVERALRARGEHEIARAIALAAQEGIEARGVVVDGAPLEEIVRASAACDLVVMGSHGLGFVRRMLVGSIAQAVLHHVKRPVLVVPPT